MKLSARTAADGETDVIEVAESRSLASPPLTTFPSRPRSVLTSNSKTRNTRRRVEVRRTRARARGSARARARMRRSGGRRSRSGAVQRRRGLLFFSLSPPFSRVLSHSEGTWRRERTNRERPIARPIYDDGGDKRDFEMKQYLHTLILLL